MCLKKKVKCMWKKSTDRTLFKIPSFHKQTAKYGISVHRAIQNSGQSPEHPNKTLKLSLLRPRGFGADDHEVPFFLNYSMISWSTWNLMYLDEKKWTEPAEIWMWNYKELFQIWFPVCQEPKRKQVLLKANISSSAWSFRMP